MSRATGTGWPESARDRAARLVDGGVAGFPFGAIVPGVIVVQSVAVPLAIRLIVLLRIGDDVGEREAVMAGDEMTGGRRAPELRLEDI